MPQDRVCNTCRDKNGCQDIYHKLTESASPSVVLQALVAFVLPIAVFVLALVAIEKIGSVFLGSSGLVTAVGSLGALAVVAGCVFVAGALRLRRERRR